MNGAYLSRVRFVRYGEDDLDATTQVEAPRYPADTQSALLTDLTNAPDGRSRQQLVRAMLKKARFDWICYCRVRRVGDSVSHAAWFDTYSPPGWPERYERDRFFEIDPRVPFACSEDWPIAWDTDSLLRPRRGEAAETDARRFIAAASGAGLRSGVTFGIPTRKAFEHCIVTLSSNLPTRTWVTDATIGEAYAIGIALHAFVEPRVERLLPGLLPELGTSTLSQAQLAILRYVAQGLSNREMAERLAMSTHTIAYHLRRLETAYKAQNRVQLAYIAGRAFSDRLGELV
jgi:DNA-binding CsgD family transcriptional regulator